MLFTIITSYFALDWVLLAYDSVFCPFETLLNRFAKIMRSALFLVG